MRLAYLIVFVGLLLAGCSDDDYGRDLGGGGNTDASAQTDGFDLATSNSD